MAMNIGLQDLTLLRAMTNSPQLLKATSPAAKFDLRFPREYADDEAGVL